MEKNWEYYCTETGKEHSAELIKDANGLSLWECRNCKLILEQMEDSKP